MMRMRMPGTVINTEAPSARPGRAGRPGRERSVTPPILGVDATNPDLRKRAEDRGVKGQDEAGIAPRPGSLFPRG